MTRTAAELLFNPRSVVVYGASSDPDKLSGRPLAYLKKFGYAGDVYAINPRRSQVQGVNAYPDVASIPGAIDLAIIVVPADSVLDAVQSCADNGVGAAIIFASGFAEIGDEGRPAQDRLTAISRKSGMRIIGPNCLGSFSAGHRAFATFSTAFDDDAARPDSPIALVSQSGAVGTFTYSTMNALGMGVRYFANTGNEADVTVVQLLLALVESPDVNVLLGHLEGVKDLEALETLASAAAERGKPLILLKAGRTTAGSRAVAAHTASTAGDDAVFSKILDDHGAVRVDSMEAMADVALGFVSGRRAAGRRLTIVTLSGGAGALAADAASELGIDVSPWQSTNRELLAKVLPYFGSTGNPIDVTGSMINDVSIMARTLNIVGSDDETDVVLVVLGNADKGATEIVETLTAANASTDKPFFVAWTGGSGWPRRELLAHGIPTYADPRRAVHALSCVIDHSVRTVRSLTST